MSLSYRGLQLLIPHTQSLTYQSYIQSLSPLLWLRLQETAGNAVNSGSEGGTGTVSGCTQGQTGQLGANEAYLWDGVDDTITLTNAAIPNVVAATTQRWGFLLNPTSMGESNFGIIFGFGNAAAAGDHFLQCENTNRLRARMFNSVGTGFYTEANNNQIADVVGNWAWIFFDYDDSGTRKGRMFKGISGTVSELTYAQQAALTGTLGSSSNNLNIGNISNTSLTFNGSIDEVLMGTDLWTTIIMQQIVDLTGV